MYQTTIRHSVSCSGIGLHSGREVCLTLNPACADSGIVFHIHTANGIHCVRPAPEKVLATELATTLGDTSASVSTVEHLMATIRGLSIDNLEIHVEGGEIPIMDGSARAFVRLFEEAGICQMQTLRKVLCVAQPFAIEEGVKQIRAVPYAGFRVDYTINFDHPLIGKQRLLLEITPDSFIEIAPARTFGFLRDVEYMRTHGLARGGSLANAVVLDERGVLNPKGLRFPDEFVRHKLLDFIGDMADLRLPLHGSFEIVCSGHQFNNKFLRAIVSAHSLEEMTEDRSESLFIEKANDPIPLPKYEHALPISA